MRGEEVFGEMEGRGGERSSQAGLGGSTTVTLRVIQPVYTHPSARVRRERERAAGVDSKARWSSYPLQAAFYHTIGYVAKANEADNADRLEG